ncbi:MAG: hypothetical protein K2J24_06045 [Muribaculaceae bacterium]|nr:hypothetical protein [Muribaculaceae bacterium]
MNRKLLNGLLLVAASCAAVGTFTSCKDVESDLRNEFSNQDAALEKRIAALEGDVATLQEDLATAKKNLSDQISELGTKMGKDLSDLDKKLQDQIDELAKKPHLSTEDVKNIFNDMFTEHLTYDDIKAMGFLTSADLEKYSTTEELEKIIADKIAEALEGISSCAVDCVQLEKDVRDLESLYEALSGRIDKLEEALGDAGLSKEEVEALINAATASIITDLENVKNDIQNFQTSIGDVTSDIEGINSSIENLNSQLTNMDADIRKGIEAYNYIETNKLKLEVLLGLADSLSDKLDQIDGIQEGLDKLTDETIPDMLSQIETLETKIGNVESDLTEKLNNLDTNLGNQISELNSTWTANFEDLSKKVNANAAAITALESKVNDLFNQLSTRLNALITSIITQGTYNPLFGTFSLPIGVQSNMLVNYTGQNDHGGYRFPSYNTFATYDNEPMLTQADENMLKLSGNFGDVEIGEGDLLYNDLDDQPGKLYLGKIFTTINPNNVDFGGQTLPLVNSRDEAAPVELRLKKSNELLDFGYTRANNGFYEADALVPATRDNFDKIMLRVDDNLKESAKELLKDRSRATVLGLMKGVYDQLSGILPAYGLKAAWEVDGTEYATYSAYNIAATTFRPLSYSFLHDKSIGKRLPIIDALSESLINIDASKYKFNIPDFNLSGVSANLNFTFDNITLDADANLVINAYVDIDGTQYPVEGTVDGLDDFLADINNSLNSQIAGWNEDLHTAFDEAIANLIEDLQKDINATMADMRAEINGKLEQMITDIQNEVNNRVGQYLDKFNNFISKYNELAKKINNVLANPNHYLQLTMAYNSGNGIHFLSNNINRPTQFVIAGGDVAELYPTSYTGEVLAPAYKKFIGCTNVIKDGKSAQEGDPEMQAALKRINSLGNMNQVFKGVQRRYGLPIPSDVVKGATYELVYTAVDYHGTTSTAKFYFTVK